MCNLFFYSYLLVEKVRYILKACLKLAGTLAICLIFVTQETYVH